MVGLLPACGIVGPPIPPEDVGVAVTITWQKRAQESRIGEQKPKDDSLTPPEEVPVGPVGQDQELPSLMPVGTR